MKTTTATTTQALYVGDVVWVTDTITNKGRRPHLVIALQDEWVGVCPLTHTPQGRWTTNELGGGTYIAAANHRTRMGNTTWVDYEACELYRKQLTHPTIEAALKEVARQLRTR